MTESAFIYISLLVKARVVIIFVGLKNDLDKRCCRDKKWLGNTWRQCIVRDSPPLVAALPSVTVVSNKCIVSLGIRTLLAHTHTLLPRPKMLYCPKSQSKSKDMNTPLSNKGTITWSASIHSLLCYVTLTKSLTQLLLLEGRHNNSSFALPLCCVFNRKMCDTFGGSDTQTNASTQSVPMESRGIFAFWPNRGCLIFFLCGKLMWHGVSILYIFYNFRANIR